MSKNNNNMYKNNICIIICIKKDLECLIVVLMH